MQIIEGREGLVVHVCLWYNFISTFHK